MPTSKKKYELVEAACAFWFNDNERVRSPFPKEIQPELKRKAQVEYLKWLRNLTENDREEVDDGELVGVFEMLLFGEALKLVDQDDTDLALTIHHPFMPRVGDLVDDEARGPSRVMERRLGQQDDQKPCMIVILQAVDSKETWQTEFVLPP